jgi:hypothetical protein
MIHLEKKIESIKESGKRAAAIVEDLLNIAGGVMREPEIININDVIIEYINSPELKQNKKKFSHRSNGISLLEHAKEY